MSEKTTLFLGPEEDINILRSIFSSRKTSTNEIANITGKKKGTVHNAIHDLKILSLIDEKLIPSEDVNHIIYDRNSKKFIEEKFISVEGYKEAIKEINLKGDINNLDVGKIFCFHTHARSTKESSIKQIGNIYLRWLKYLDLIKNKEEINKNES
jgi:predicted transcriptional regulator